MFEEINGTVWIFGPLVGLVGMIAGGYWSVGCGWLVVPSMLLMGLPPSEAVGISLLQMIPSTIPTVIRTAGNIGWQPEGLGRRLILPMAAGAVLMSFSGRIINDWMYRCFGSSALMILFMFVMIVIGIQTLLSRSREDQGTLRVFSLKASGLAFLGGLGTGVFSSVLGVGGAMLMRPILASGFKVPERETSSSIRLLLLVTTFTGGMFYTCGSDGFNLRILLLALLVSVGGMIGFPLGVKLHNIVAENGYVQHIHKSFSTVAAIVITSTLLKLMKLQTLSCCLMLFFALVLLSYLLSFAWYAKRHPQLSREDRAVLMQNLRDLLRESAAGKTPETMQPDGTWSDIDYSDHSRGSNWSPLHHLGRMFQLAAVQPELAVQALAAWKRLDPSSENWWHGCIGTPRQLCRTILLIGPEAMPPGLLKELEPVIRRTYVVRKGKKFTGQNLVWVEEIRLVTGLLYHDDALIREGCEALRSELKIAAPGKEGLQDDFTFHQHGRQNQIGNYGRSFLEGQLFWSRAFQGTRLARSAEEVALLDHFFMDCMRWTMLDGVMDYNFCGRQLWEGAPERKYRTLMKIARGLQTIVPAARAEEYKRWLNAPESLQGAVAFPRSGSLICRAENGWYFSVRMSSAKLKGCETVNSENMQGLFQEDGLAFFGSMKRYRGFPALYDQRLLPGTTEVQNTASLLCRKHNEHGYYAVLADGSAAIAAMRLEAKELQADKVWFCTKSGVYCSGSGIHSDSDDPVVTTVDQYLADSEAFFPFRAEGENIQRKEEFRKGNWQESFGEFPSKEISGNVVTLTIPHGIKPDGAVYRYALRPLSAAPAPVWLKTSSPRIHALLADGKILTAAFEAGTVELPEGGIRKLAPGIAVLSAAGEQLRQADFREE